MRGRRPGRLAWGVCPGLPAIQLDVSRVVPDGARMLQSRDVILKDLTPAGARISVGVQKMRLWPRGRGSDV